MARDEPPSGVGGCGWSWCKTLADTWETCGFTEAMGVLKSVIPSLVGSSQVQDLERIEESALIALLDLETVADRLWQQASLASDTTDSSLNPSTAPSLDELSHLIDLIRFHISQAKTLSTNPHLQLLLQQDKHREKVKFILQESWQALEEDIVLTHLKTFHSQEILRDLVRTSTSKNQERGRDDGFLDVVEIALEDSVSCERIEISIQATQENIVTGQSGISGLAQHLISKLTRLEYDMRASRDLTLDLVRRADRRWGIVPSDEQDQLETHYFNDLPHHDPKNHQRGFYPVYYYGPYHASQHPPLHNTTETSENAAGGTTDHGHVINCQSCKCNTCTACYHSVPLPLSPRDDNDSDMPPVYDPERDRAQRAKMEELSKPRQGGHGENPTPLLYQEFGKGEGPLHPTFSKAQRFQTKEVSRVVSLLLFFV
jgi:hypothetical protein